MLDPTDPLIGLGTLDDRLLMPGDLEKRMTSDDTGLVGKNSGVTVLCAS